MCDAACCFILNRNVTKVIYYVDFRCWAPVFYFIAWHLFDVYFEIEIVCDYDKLLPIMCLL